jgi:hypothetical protein
LAAPEERDVEYARRVVTVESWQEEEEPSL